MPAGGNRGYDGVPENLADAEEHRRMLARAVNRLNLGKLNGTVDLTLRASQTSTTLTDPRLAATSFLMWMPQTASASVAERAGIYVTGRTKGSAVLNHVSNAATDQTFTILIIG
jgi:hypothetical protein